MTTYTTHPFDREIHYVPRRSDFCYDVFVHGTWVASVRYYAVGDFVADEVGYSQVLAQPSADTLVIRANAPAQLAACVADTSRCACGDAATLIIHDGDTPLPSCERCFEIEYVQDKEGGQDWTVEPLTPDPLTPTGPCYVCGEPARQADTTGPLCPDHAGVLALFEGVAVQPIAADALLAEADAALGCPGTGMGLCGNAITATGYCARCTRFLDQVFVAATRLTCSYCGAAHTDAACPQRQSVRLTVCGNCNGTHSIQVCPAIRQRLFAA